MIDFTEITNIAGQRHNARQFENDITRQSGASREQDEQAAAEILRLLGLNVSDLLLEIGKIESELYDDARDDETRFEIIDRACANLRYYLTDVIGE